MKNRMERQLSPGAWYVIKETGKAPVIHSASNTLGVFRKTEEELGAYDIRYTVWTQMKITERFGGIGEFAEELSRVKNADNTKSTELLLEVFAILLNQQIKVRNKEEKKNAFTVDAEYLMMSQTSEKIVEMISLTYEVLLEAFPKKEQNAAENELDTLAAKELGDEDGEENEKN